MTDAAVARFVRVVAGAAAVGLLVGGLVAGVGGRLAMRLLAVTSDDRLRGLITDDEAEVGEITLDGTIGFIIFMALGGAVLALAYLGVRRWLPASRAWRALCYGALFTAIQGSDIFDADGFDFTRLEPLWLAVGLFLAIMLATGALVSLGVERAIDQWPSPTRRSWWSVLPLLPLILFFPILVPVVVGGACALAIQRSPRLASAWSSPVVTVLGAVLLVALGLGFGVPAAGEVAEILG